MSLRSVVGRALLSACILSNAGILVPLGEQGIAFAQTSKGSVTGRVTDAVGDVIPDAAVKIRSMDTGEVTEVRTDSSGVYLVAALQPGRYSITITKDGFDTAQFTSVNVNIASVATVDARMKIGRTTEVVTVRAEEQLIDRSASNVSVDVPEEVSANIPLPERSAMEVVTLSPGVQGDPQYNMGVQSENPGIYTQPVTPGGSLSVGGGRPGSALQLVDGVDLSMVGYPRVGLTFSGDALKQITVQSTGIEAKYGRSGGGVINQASKGGSLVYHGKVSFRHMDPFFEATTYGQGTLTFQTPAGPKIVPVTQNVHQNIYTFLLSGPVPISWHRMNKNTFFFASYEPLRAGQKVFTRTRIPTPQELSGDFSNSYTILNTNILASQGYAAAVAAPRVGGIFYQFPRNANGFPTGARYNSSSQYVAVPGNNLSSQLNQNAFAQYVLSQFPTPAKNGSGNAYVNFLTPDLSYANDGNNALTARGVVNKDDRYNIRIDQNLGNSDHAFARYTYVPVVGTRYNFLGPDSPIANQPETVANSRNAILDYTHIFGGSVSNDVRVSYTQLNYINQPASSSTTIDYAAKYGLTPSLTGVGFPTIAIDTGTYGSSTGGNDGGISNNKVYSVGDDLSFVFKNHSVSIGGEFRAMQLDRLPNAGIFGGSYNFSAGSTNNGSAGGNGTASFILGSINTLTLSTYQKFYYRYKYAGLYAMDAWRLTPKLTLNYGLRYHLEVPRKEKNGLQGSFVPDIAGSLNGVSATGAFAFSGNNGLPESLYPINWKAFEPRVGFAYAATPALVIRGSFGLIHAPMTGVSNSNIPSLTPSSLTIGGANGGTNPAAWVNYMTNPVAIPTGGIPGVLRGPNPFFSYGSNGFLPYVSQSSAVPYTQSWSFGLQYQASRSTVIQATYAGSASRHLFSPPADTNIMPLSTIVSEIKSGFNFSSNATVSKYGSAVPNGNANINLVPFPQFSNNPIATAFVRSNSASYNALYLNGIQRAFAGLTLIGSFTWAKSMDDGSSGSIDGIATDIYGFTYPQTPFSKQGEWSYSSFDTPTHVTGAYNWAIPFGRGKNFDLHNRFANGVLGGLSTSGVFNAQSGYPMWAILNSVGYFYSSPSLTPGNYGKNGNAITTGAGHYNLRPNIVPGVPLIQSNWRNDPFNLSGKGGYINPAAFSVPGGPGDPQLGNAPRTLGGARNPRIIYFDMHAAKKISLHENRVNLNFGVDAINIFNHTNFFLNPSTAQHGITSSLSSTTGQYTNNANFGILNSANNTPGRTFALSGSLTF